MKTFKQHLEEQYLNESLSKKVLHDLEKFADRLFSKLNIDIAFTKHFKDRINDERNEPEIKASEMSEYFVYDLDLELYEQILESDKNKIDSNIIADIWQFMKELRTCDNGGFNAYCCPYGCHTVSFDKLD